MVFCTYASLGDEEMGLYDNSDDEFEEEIVEEMNDEEIDEEPQLSSKGNLTSLVHCKDK